MITTHSRLRMDTILSNSFKDYHVKGFSYLCLERSTSETIKLYFFDGDVSKLPEIVSPHDHRYDFHTWVLAGASENIWYEERQDGQLFNKFDYFTPLNGGNGFHFNREVQLGEVVRDTYTAKSAKSHYFMRHDEIHTIRMVENETVLMLRQFEDVVEDGSPTSTFLHGNAAPSLSGLYSRFTADEVTDLLCKFRERTGLRIETM